MGIRASSLSCSAGAAAATATASAVSDTLISDNPSIVAEEPQGAGEGATTRTAVTTEEAAGEVGERSTPPRDSSAVMEKNKGAVRMPGRRLSKPTKVDSLLHQVLQDETETVLAATARAPKPRARREPNGKKSRESTTSTTSDHSAGRGRTARAGVSGIPLRNKAGATDVLGWEVAFSACSRHDSPPTSTSRRLSARTRLNSRNAATAVTASSTPKKKLPAVPSFQPTASDTKEGRGALEEPAVSTTRRFTRTTRVSTAVAVSPWQSSSQGMTAADSSQRPSKRKRSPSPPSSSPVKASPLKRTRPPPQAAGREIGCRSGSKTKPKSSRRDVGRAPASPKFRRGAAATRRLINNAVEDNHSTLPSCDDALPKLHLSSPTSVVRCCPAQNLGFWEGSPGVGGCTLPPCGEEGCVAPASFGFMESGRVDVCKRHAAMGMVDLLNARCGMEDCACHYRPSNALSSCSSTQWSTLG